MKIQDLWIGALHLLGQAWWVEITTDRPHCTYYFGPFATAVEADLAKGGYIEDLEGESAQGISVTIKRCKPEQLTIDLEPQPIEKYAAARSKASMSGQLS
jgi:hypothetical protein